MRPGHTFTIEPIFLLHETTNFVMWRDGWTFVAPGVPSAQWEHTVLITEEGCEVITKREEEEWDPGVPKEKTVVFWFNLFIWNIIAFEIPEIRPSLQIPWQRGNFTWWVRITVQRKKTTKCCTLCLPPQRPFVSIRVLSLPTLEAVAGTLRRSLLFLRDCLPLRKIHSTF